MSAYKEVHLYCDEPGCYVKFEPQPGLGFLSVVSVARREAKKAGWIAVRSNLGRAFDKDYCPEHGDVRKPAARATLREDTEEK